RGWPLGDARGDARRGSRRHRSEVRARDPRRSGAALSGGKRMGPVRGAQNPGGGSAVGPREVAGGTGGPDRAGRAWSEGDRHALTPARRGGDRTRVTESDGRVPAVFRDVATVSDWEGGALPPDRCCEPRPARRQRQRTWT